MPPSTVTGKYILIAHGKQLTTEKYDFPFNFESLSFFIPSGYVLENPTYTTGMVNISKYGELARLLCINSFNVDRISKVPVNGMIQLRNMSFSLSEADKEIGKEDFLLNGGLYYCSGSSKLEIILNAHELIQKGRMTFMDIMEEINIHSQTNNINPRTTAVFFYTCRSSRVEGRKGSFAPIIFPFRGPEKVIGQSGPSMRQKQGVFGQLSQTIEIKHQDSGETKNELETRGVIGGLNSSQVDSPVIPVDEDSFYKYISGGTNIKNKKGIYKKGIYKKNNKRFITHKIKYSNNKKRSNKNKLKSKKNKYSKRT